MPTKNHKEAEKLLESNGYRFDRKNSKSCDVFVRDGSPDVVLGTVSEQFVKKLRTSFQRERGERTDGDRSKRNAASVKARQEQEREAAREATAKHQLELDALIARRDDLLNGLGAVLTDREVRDITRRIEEEERELAYWRRLMTESPDVNAHSGRLRAQHRS